MAWYRCSGNASLRIPQLLKVESKSRMYADATFTHTFTESGKYQYILVLGNDNTTTASDITVKLNDTAQTPTSGLFTGTSYFYGEITASANDVLTITAPLYQQLGANVFVFKNADISNISMIGFSANDGSTFPINIPENTPFVEVYKTGYHAGNNNFNYIYSLKGMETYRDSVSIPTPAGEQACWWGFTYVMTV